VVAAKAPTTVDVATDRIGTVASVVAGPNKPRRAAAVTADELEMSGEEAWAARGMLRQRVPSPEPQLADAPEGLRTFEAEVGVAESGVGLSADQREHAWGAASSNDAEAKLADFFADIGDAAEAEPEVQLSSIVNDAVGAGDAASGDGIVASAPLDDDIVAMSSAAASSQLDVADVAQGSDTSAGASLSSLEVNIPPATNGTVSVAAIEAKPVTPRTAAYLASDAAVSISTPPTTTATSATITTTLATDTTSTTDPTTTDTDASAVTTIADAATPSDVPTESALTSIAAPHPSTSPPSTAGLAFNSVETTTSLTAEALAAAAELYGPYWSGGCDSDTDSATASDASLDQPHPAAGGSHNSRSSVATAINAGGDVGGAVTTTSGGADATSTADLSVVLTAATSVGMSSSGLAGDVTAVDVHPTEMHPTETLLLLADKGNSDTGVGGHHSSADGSAATSATISGNDGPPQKRIRLDGNIRSAIAGGATSSAKDGGGPATSLPPNSESVDAATATLTRLWVKLEQIGIADVSATPGVSPWHIERVRLQTRFDDWKGGHLDPDFFMAAVEAASAGVEAYLATLAPTGWQCHYDSVHGTYFYVCDASGECTYEYPTGDGDAYLAAGTAATAAAAAAAASSTGSPHESGVATDGVAQPPPPDTAPPPTDAQPPPPPDAPPPQGEVQPPPPPPHALATVGGTGAGGGVSAGAGGAIAGGGVGAIAIAGGGAAGFGDEEKRKQKKKKTVKSKGFKSKKMEQQFQHWEKKKEALVGSDDETREQRRERELDQWRTKQIQTGASESNPNFVALQGDWRKRQQDLINERESKPGSG
jgi:hypothetical protein